MSEDPLSEVEYKTIWGRLRDEVGDLYLSEKTSIRLIMKQFHCGETDAETVRLTLSKASETYQSKLLTLPQETDPAKQITRELQVCLWTCLLDKTKIGLEEIKRGFEVSPEKVKDERATTDKLIQELWDRRNQVRLNRGDPSVFLHLIENEIQSTRSYLGRTESMESSPIQTVAISLWREVLLLLLDLKLEFGTFLEKNKDESKQQSIPENLLDESESTKNPTEECQDSAPYIWLGSATELFLLYDELKKRGLVGGHRKGWGRHFSINGKVVTSEGKQLVSQATGITPKLRGVLNDLDSKLKGTDK